MLSILLKKSICQSVAKFLSNPLTLFGILIQVRAAQDAIVAVQRNKIKRADFFNRILSCPDRPFWRHCCGKRTAHYPAQRAENDQFTTGLFTSHPTSAQRRRSQRPLSITWRRTQSARLCGTPVSKATKSLPASRGRADHCWR